MAKQVYENLGKEDAVTVGNWIVEDLKAKNKFEAFKQDLVKESLIREDPKSEVLSENFRESTIFKEAENTMANSSDLYTVALAKKVYYTSYDKYKNYYDSIFSFTPADLGMPEGAGSYQIPKIVGTTASKITGGAVTEYANDGKDEVTLTTDTYAIGTRITRRLIKRGAKGFIMKFMEAGSDAVHIAFATDIANGLGNGCDSYLTGGVSFDKIEEAKKTIKTVTNSKGRIFGFRPNTIAFSAEGYFDFLTSEDIKAIVSLSQAKFGSEVMAKNDFTIWNGMRVLEADLMSATESGESVKAVVYDKMYYLGMLLETGMDTYTGRLPGTAGNEEIIQAMDAGFVIMNAEAGVGITD